MLTRLAAALVSMSLATTNVFASANAPHEMPVRIVEAPTATAVRAALAVRRAHNLAAFRAYWKGGVYPHNTFRVGPLNVWRDADGHLCAAATMIDKDGKHALVNKTAETDNNIRLLDVTKGQLLDWMLTSGFTIEEIDRIQAPMVEPDIDSPEQRTLADARLRAGYEATDKWLVENAKSSLDTAVARVMKNPELARRLVDGRV
jgi:hypothetical protein